MSVEAVIDKDRAAGLLAEELGAYVLLMRTDVEAVYEDWGTPRQKPIRRIRPNEIDLALFPAGSMRPKVEAARNFVARPGRIAGIGRLQDAKAIIEGRAGTLIER